MSNEKKENNVWLQITFGLEGFLEKTNKFHK